MTEKLAGVSSMPKGAKKSQTPVEAARERGEDLTGPGGLLKTLTKTVLETAME